MKSKSIYDIKSFEDMVYYKGPIEEVNNYFNKAIQTWNWDQIWIASYITVRNMAIAELSKNNVSLDPQKLLDRCLDITSNVIKRLHKEEQKEKQTGKKFEIKNISTFHYLYVRYLFTTKYIREDEEEENTVSLDKIYEQKKEKLY